MPKNIAILGSTGSIGRSTLEVIEHLGWMDSVKVLVAKENIELLKKQIEKFHPELVVVYDANKAAILREWLPNQEILEGDEGLIAAATYDNVELVLSALVGAIGICPTAAAIECGKDIALANKEVLVSAGEYITQRARAKNVKLLPVDSEHCAIFQCLQGGKMEEVSRLILTASGGPFKNHSIQALSQVTLQEALKHPTWSMGPKITIDSSTLMNKGLEAIEAHWLFNCPIDKIEVVIHPQSMVHSFVEFHDGSMLAQISQPHMKLPIQYALTYPTRVPGMLAPFDFSRSSEWQFFPPDFEKFRCLKLAFHAAREGGSLPCYMNAANEIFVERFLQGQMSWNEIGIKLERLMEKHSIIKNCNLETIFAVDAHARLEAAYI